MARLVAASPSSVLRWKRALEEGGVEALKAKPHPGWRPWLTAEQKRELVDLLQKGPLAAGFFTDLWTLTRVALVIERHFGMKYHPGYVWRILREPGWSARKPEGRAREHDEVAIRRWREESWPQVKKSPAGRLAHRPERRKRVYASACGAAHLGTERANAHPVQLVP